MTAAIEVPVNVESNARVPVQARQGDAGYDLVSMEGYNLAPGEREPFRTGIAVAIPEGYVGYIKPRSGLAFRHGIDVLGGVIDSGYRGEILVILINHGQTYFTVTPGDRIAQLVIQPVASVEFQHVLVLPESARGIGGFGSTGTL